MPYLLRRLGFFLLTLLAARIPATARPVLISELEGNDTAAARHPQETSGA